MPCSLPHGAGSVRVRESPGATCRSSRGAGGPPPAPPGGGGGGGPRRRGGGGGGPPPPPPRGGGAAGEAPQQNRPPPMSGCRVRYPMARVQFASGNRLERRAEVAVDRLDERVGYGLVGHRAGVDAVEAEERAERRGRARWSRRRVRKRRNGSRR